MIKKDSRGRLGVATKPYKPLESIAAPLESDSDEEFNVDTLAAEAEASYKHKGRRGRGRPSGRQTQSAGSSVKSRKDILDTTLTNPLPALLGLEERNPEASLSQMKLTDTWRSSPPSNAKVTTGQIRSEPTTEADDTATEPESDDEQDRGDKKGQIPSKRPSKSNVMLRTTKRARKSPSLPADSGTETEPSEDDEPPPISASLVPSFSVLKSGLDISAGSSQSTNYEPKPFFPPPADQVHLGPLHLPSTNPRYVVQVPASINRQLREYQRDGVRFFHERWVEGRGGLLGDDMGLGKTIQVIAFLSAALAKTGDNRDMHRRRDRVRALQDEGLARADLPRADKKWGTCLVICPKTVVGNWERELDTWGYFEYATYLGDRDERNNVLKDFTMGRLDIVLTAFDTARTNIDQLSDLPWTMVFVDEVHRCKNPTSGITIALNKFSCHIRFGLTGTAIQNGYKELWTLLDWCAPGKIGTQNQWKLSISLPLADGQAHRATQAQVSKARLLAERLVHRLLLVFFLRRTKALIADQMPRKFDQVAFCPLAKTQLEVYRRFLETKDVKLMTRKDEPCDCGSSLRRGYCCHTHNDQGVPWKDLVLKYMQLFVEISNHIILICPGFKGETDEQRARRREYVKIAFPGQTIRQADLLHDDSLCGKWKVLSYLLDTWKDEGDNKVLIFSKSVKILEMLEHQMKRKNFNFCYMDGKTKQEERMASLERFNNNPNVFVFLISTLVGGTGLNMTSANKVVIFGERIPRVGGSTKPTQMYRDPNWNPAHDLQAMDRAYRFGQKRDVNVYRLLGAGALEELIYARQIYKQQQMHMLHETALATKMTIEKANLAEINWALANMDSTPEGTIQDSPSMNERNLADFMLDDSAPTPPNNGISDILNSAGVAYSHNHQNVLMVSHVEKNITSAAIAGSRREYREAVVTLANEGAPEKKTASTWPPKRKTLTELSPMERLEARVEALIELGLIKDRDSLAEFGREFARMPECDQRAILLNADRTLAKNIHKD